MKEASRSLGRVSIFQGRRAPLLPLFFITLLAPPHLTAQVPVPAPAFVNDGAGADVDWWNSSSGSRANWGVSNFGGATFPKFYSYRLNTSNALPDVNVVAAGQTPQSQSPPTSAVLSGLSLAEGQTYYFWVSAEVVQGGASAWTPSDGFTVDTTAPVAAMSALNASIATAASFSVAWSATDAGSGVDYYDVQYRVNGGPWTTLLTHTGLTGTMFTGDNGSTYTFRVSATDRAGNTGGWAQSSDTVVNVMGTSLALSSYPTSLSFSGSDTAMSYSLGLEARGSSVNVTDIRESRTYASWPRDDGPWESLPLSIPGGTEQTIGRSAALSVLQRSRALGSGSTGGFGLILTVRGTDGSGNPVQATLNITAAVTSAPPSGLTVTGVSIQLPVQPYSVGDSVTGQVTISATGSGTVTGQVTVDGSTSWSGSPSFTVGASGDTTFSFPGIPTAAAGSHTVSVDLATPVILHADATYIVNPAAAAVFPSVIDLVKNVAQLTGLTGTAVAAPGSGYTDYTFTGSATIKLLSLASVTLPGVTVSGLGVRIFDNLSTPPQIISGKVEIAASGPSSLTDFAGGYLKIRRVAFDFGKASNHLSVDASIALPYLAQELLTAKDLVLDASGITSVVLSWDTSKAQSFTLFGMTFSIHDVPGSGDDVKALAFGKDSSKGYYIGISGAVSLKEKQGVTTTVKELATFRNNDLRFYTDGTLVGNISLASVFELIPGKLPINAIGIAKDVSGLKLSLSGVLKDLPSPLNKGGDLPISVSIDAAGNMSAAVPLIHKLKSGNKGHALVKSPAPGDFQWDLGLGTLSMTYLSLDLVMTSGTLDLDQSKVSLALDIYLDLLAKGGGKPSDDDKRITFGELDSGGALQGGLIIDFSGNVTWPTPTNLPVLKDKRLAFGPVKLVFDKVAIDPNPFALVITGSIAMDMDAISGGMRFDNLKIGLDGVMGDVGAAVTAGGGGALSVLDAVQIEVKTVAWSGSPSTITIDRNTSTGSGETLGPSSTSTPLAVDNYFSMKGASITLGSGSDSLMSGGFQELTVYTDSGSKGTGFVVRQAELSLSGTLDLMADMEYSPSPLAFSFAGSVDIPDAGINGAAMGKVGTLNGKPSMGLFVDVSLGEAGIPIGPGVILNEIGGGFFINPSDDDISYVRKTAKFERPEMNDEIASRRPGGASNNQAFALMILAGLTVAEKDLVSGRALVTVTSSYFNLDAEVELLDGMATGKAYLAVSWEPSYAEGKVTMEMAYPSHDDSIVSGTGDMDFYFYPGIWGIDGKLQVKVIEIATVQGEMFVGSPGFMVQATASAGIDLGVVSGSVSLGGMFWYYIPDSSLGAYAQVTLKGSFLAGLFSAEAGLEGALIVTPSFLVYSVGSLSVDVLGIEVFNGSLWFSVAESGLDGGTGRNSQYDKLIDDARNMASVLKAAKDQLAASLEQAKLDLAKLSDEQAALAGKYLLEQGSLALKADFDKLETANWGVLPPALAGVYDILFGPKAASLALARKQLADAKKEIDALLVDLETMRKDVSTRLSDYQDILVEKLPSVQDVGSLGNPFQGMQQKTVTVGSATKTVKSGFLLDNSKAASEQGALSSVRESFAQYQEAFIQTAGGIDARLQKLDEILFQGQSNLTALDARFAQIHSKLSKFTDDFVQFQGQAIAYAGAAVQKLESPQALSDITDAINLKAASLSSKPASLMKATNDRISLINKIMIAADPKLAPANPNDPDPNAWPYKEPTDTTGNKNQFSATGSELWYHTPDAGLNASGADAAANLPTIIKSFSTSSAALLKNWGSATDLTDQVFQRKADLYGILYEIYDQLATYGSGNIGIASDGNAAGFKGISALGLSFRASALSKSMGTLGTPLPSGTIAPSTPTFGTNRPLQQLKAQPPGPPVIPSQLKSQGSIPGAGNSGMVALGFESIPSVGAGQALGFSGVIQFKETPKGLPASGAFDRAVVTIPAAVLTPTSWVPVRTYFAAKRAETAPYLVIPTVTSLSGTAASSSDLEALLSASFSGTHPVGVVEYEYKIEVISITPASGPDSLYKYLFNTGGKISLPSGIQASAPAASSIISIAASGSSSSKASISLYSSAPSLALGKSGSAASSVLSGAEATISAAASASIRADILGTTPWLSLGNVHDLNYLFLSRAQSPGKYSLLVRMRGAGGRAIVRQGRFTVAYAVPGGSVPVSSGMDTSDKTPPTTPVVTLSGAFTANKDTLYASWSADDPESGIQGYKYALEPYTDATASAATGAVAAASSGGGSGGVSALSMGSGTTTTVAFFSPSGPLVSSEDAASHAWIEAQGRTEANIRGLSLVQGKRYVVWVMVTNGVGRASIGHSDPIFVDATPPLAPEISAFAQTTADGHANSLSFQFTPGTDPESGISGNTFAVGQTETDQKLWPWTVVSGTSAIAVDLPIQKGQSVTLRLKSANGSGLETETRKTIKIQFTDSTPPSVPTVLTNPQNFTSNTSKLAFSWARALDPESGVASYEYGLGTAPDKADVVTWTPSPASFSPYLLGQGPQAAQSGPAMNAVATAVLKDKAAYYALVRVTNGNGLSSIAAASPVIVDLTPPDVTITASAESPGTERISVDVKAKDAESGSARYRAKVWEVAGPVAEKDAVRPMVIPVAGWSSSGTLGKTIQSGVMGIVTDPTAWYTTQWQPLSIGAPPQNIDVQVLITGFPGKGLEMGKYYRVAIEVENGAGVSGQSNSVVVKIVAPITGYKFVPRFKP